MNWYHEWQSLCARIQGLLDAAIFFYSANERSSSDDFSIRKKILLSNAEKIFIHLNAYQKKYEKALPNEAYESLENFLTEPNVKKFNFKPSQGQTRGHVQFALTSLAAFKSEFSYIIADTQAVALKITERAFIHLQRSIIADEEVRKKWKSAFSAGEIKCEKLGALHLLWHGVWAFKIDAVGGRTDLILNEPLPDDSAIEESSSALVLTEWKIVRDNNALNPQIKAAHKQAKLYRSGILASIELTNYRYLVMVSEKNLAIPKDIKEDTITYRLINLAVNPNLPSIEAKKS